MLGARLAAAAIAMACLPGATPVSSLALDVAKLRSTHGMIRICLTAVPKNFPACGNGALAVTRSVPASGHDISYEGLPYGSYAIAVIHDENGNGKLDTFAGIPREGFGFSRNPVITFGPPSFDAAHFTLATDANAQQIRMRYLL
jgi:uncharacterized protein (DUF2141 family)